METATDTENRRYPSIKSGDGPESQLISSGPITWDRALDLVTTLHHRIVSKLQDVEKIIPKVVQERIVN